jgi:hypothetical protein
MNIWDFHSFSVLKVQNVDWNPSVDRSMVLRTGGVRVTTQITATWFNKLCSSTNCPPPKYTGRSAARLRPVLYLVQSVHKWYTPNPRNLSSPLYRRYVLIFHWSRRGLSLRNLQHGLAATESWCECWNVKINEEKTQAIYFSHRRTPVKAFLTLKGRHIPFANHV